MSSEHWLPVRGYENFYEVSDLGRVRSLPRKVRFGTQFRLAPARILSPISIKTRRDGKSRKVVNLSCNNVKRWAMVPWLVLETFVGPRPSLMHVCRHLNCDPSDNSLSNLAWGTHEENVADTRRVDHIFRGEQHGEAKLTNDQVLEIRRLRAANVTCTVVAARFNVSRMLVSLIARRKAWKHV